MRDNACVNCCFESRLIEVPAGSWPRVVPAITGPGASAVAARGGSLFGLFVAQIGLPSHQGLVLTAWSDTDALARGAGFAVDGVSGVRTVSSERVEATVRPTEAVPRTEPGVYAHRWFEIADADWPEFLELSQAAWPEFEKSFGVEVQGLFRSLDAEAPDARVLLITRYPSLAVWERSRRPAGPGLEQEASFACFRRRARLTRSTVVVTTRLAGAPE